ncbi:MAG TPA: IS4 family transposase [Lutibacter sp.]
MAETNIKIIEELKEFLKVINSNKKIKELFIEKSSDFSRNRTLTFNRTILMLLNMPKRSLAIEVREFFELIADNSITCTKSAFSSQRIKLKPLFFELWNKLLVDCFHHYYGEKVKKWNNFLLIGVDGSTAYLFNKEEVRDYFGVQENQFTQTPIARVMKFYDVLNKITIFSKICPIKISEQTIVADHIEKLPENSLSIYDRGFPGFALMYLHINQERPRHFVMRSKTGFNEQVKAFMNSAENDIIVEMFPKDKAIKKLYQYGYCVTKKTSIKVRMVKVVLNTGEIEVLLTNLYDQDIYKTACFKDLYYMRWGVETSYGADKNAQQLEQFSGHTVCSIKQDFYALIFVANLQSLIEKQCEPFLEKINKKRVHNYKINKNISIGSMKNKIVKLFLTEDPEGILLYLQNLFEQHIEPIRPNRSYSRKIVKKSPRFKTLTNYKRAI